MTDPIDGNARVHFSLDAARAFAVEVLARLGYAPGDAALVADHVVDAAACGYEYSGLPKLLNVAELRAARGPVRPLATLHETPVSARLDGGNEVGMVTVLRATDMAIAKARARGFAVVGVANTWMSGRSAYYVERIARAGLVGIHTIASRPQVAPPGAAQAAVGTNPVAVGVPTTGDPLVIDLGTSAFMFTDLMFRARRGELLPEGVALDAAGRPTRDPAAALAGAVLPLGGHKGFALAMAMTGLGILAGAGTDRDRAGYLVMAIRPDLLVPEDELRREVSSMLARVRGVARQPGVEAIRIPSERGFRERARAQREGIAIDRGIYEALCRVGGCALPGTGGGTPPGTGGGTP